MRSLLIAGGRSDPNLGWLQAAAERLGIASRAVLVDVAAPPAFDWNPLVGRACVDGIELECSSAFLRYDVFSGLADGKAETAASAGAWFATLSAYCATAGVFAFNSEIDMVSASKPAMLSLARSCGLAVSETVITNRRAVLDPMEANDWIAKPVAGGSYVQDLATAVADARWIDGRSPSPAIVQRRLAYPERRIYRIGPDFFAFDIASKTLDSRLDPTGAIAPVPLDRLPESVLGGIGRLTDRIRCDFCAIDMKTDPRTGDLVFLELNNGPMFMGYDRTTGGAMAEAMVRFLMRDASG